MNNKEFGAALAEICETKLLAEELSLPEDFEFSESFEAKMSGIIGKERKPFLRGRLKAALIIAAIFAAGFCISMTNKMKWNYTAEDSDGGRTVNFNIGSVEDFKLSLDEIYTLDGIPKEYTRVICDNMLFASVQIWVDAPDNGNSIHFCQSIPSAYKDAFFPEEMTLSLYEEDGIQYMFGEAEDLNYSSVVWYQQGYVFLITGDLPKNELLKLCKTLKIEESE